MAYGAAAIEGRRGLPELPAEVTHVWSMFCDLSAARAHSVPIAYPDIEAYGRLTGMMPTPWEVAQIKRLDAAALEIWAQQATRKGARNRVAGTDSEGVKAILRSAARR